MRRILWIALCLAGTVNAAPRWDEQQQQIVHAMQQLADASDYKSASIDDYASQLCDDFTRWTIGSQAVSDKDGWVEGVSIWIARGWSVAARTAEILDIEVNGEFAFSRRIVTEAYIGPNQQSAMSTSALAETWHKDSSGWKLHRLSVHPLPTPAVK